jgi:hypothetical protein
LLILSHDKIQAQLVTVASEVQGIQLRASLKSNTRRQLLRVAKGEGTSGVDLGGIRTVLIDDVKHTHSRAARTRLAIVVNDGGKLLGGRLVIVNRQIMNGALFGGLQSSDRIIDRVGNRTTEAGHSGRDSAIIELGVGSDGTTNKESLNRDNRSRVDCRARGNVNLGRGRQGRVPRQLTHGII